MNKLVLSNSISDQGLADRGLCSDAVYERIEKSLIALEKWLRVNQYAGYDPFDGLTSHLRLLTFRKCLLERILEQIVLRSPINLRPLLGIKKRSDIAFARGHLARGYLRLWNLTGEGLFRDKAVEFLCWLRDHAESGYSGHCWGAPFDHAARGGQMPRGTPYLPETSQIGNVFVDAYEILGEQAYLETAVSVCRFIINDLPREQIDGGFCISYHPGGQLFIHNANALGAGLLARVGKIIHCQEMMDLARQAMSYTCNYQLPSGAWYYGQEDRYHWIDNFHTAYVLDGLKCYMDSTGDGSFWKELDRGINFYCTTFFLSDGRPKYYHERLFPIDIQCIAQAIDTLAYLDNHQQRSVDLAVKVAIWAIDHMQDKSGYFYYRKLPYKTVKIPMVRWGQAPMLSALVNLLIKLKTRC
jgi:hypothetical protein